MQTQTQTTITPVKAGERTHWQLRAGPWLVLALGILAYAWVYGGLMWRCTVVPTFDQAAYLSKTYHIAEMVWGGHWQALNPWMYLGDPAANRPPLLMTIAGVILGPKASAIQVGLLWLALRLGFLAYALWTLYRAVGWWRTGAWWITATGLVILAMPGGLTLYPNMWMVDQSFEAAGLLAFASLVWDWQVMSSQTALRGALATLVIMLIKPAAVVLLTPVYGLLFWRMWRRYQAEGRGLRGLPEVLRWAWPYVAMGALLLAVWASPYGWAVAQQYELGSRGYWNNGKTWVAMVGMIALLVPPWLLLMMGLSVGIWGWKPKGKNVELGEQRAMRVAAVALGVVVWWWFFNAVLTYTLDKRVLPGAMPIGVAGAMLVACRGGGVKIMNGLALTLAMVFFVGALAVADGKVTPEMARRMNTFAPMPEHQHVIDEVGLLPLAKEIRHMVIERGSVRCYEERSLPEPRLMMVTSDDFVEKAALELAWRQAGGEMKLLIDSHPWGAKDFSLQGVFRFNWFITKRDRKYTNLTGDVWTSLLAIDDLITRRDSPVRECFEKVCTQAVHQPGWDDEVTLWRLQRMPTPAELETARIWVQPRFKGTAGEKNLGHE